jgi:polyribonucleotide nucleotidyltransferase
MESRSYRCTLPNNTSEKTPTSSWEIAATFSDVASKATSAVIMSCENTEILITAVIGEEKDVDFTPLTVDIEDRFYASGRIGGNRFVRREGRPSDEAILLARIIDRSLRPLFSSDFRYETQIIVTILAHGTVEPHVLAVIGSSLVTTLALKKLKLTWQGPISAIPMVYQQEAKKWHIDPRHNVTSSLFVCGNGELVNMIELQAQEIDEKEVIKGFTEAYKSLETIDRWQKEVLNEENAHISTFSEPRRNNLIDQTKKQAAIADEQQKAIAMAEKILTTQKRIDGRTIDEIRPLFAQAGGRSPIIHGSGLFYRGETHVLSLLTLGGPDDTQILEGLQEEGVNFDEKRFIHHYNFPPYSTGETGRLGNTNRRMIGHGRLAEKALQAVIPTEKDFPYTIRIVSEVVSSNGSTSMASVCAATLALMDAGVPIRTPVAGISCGLIMKDKKYTIITDIQGEEDHYGCMDFKVAGTIQGITAIQLDVKIPGITLKIAQETLEKAKKARLSILETITKAIPEPRKTISQHAPHICVISVRPDQVSLIIGPGGRTIHELEHTPGIRSITIRENSIVYITGERESVQKVEKVIRSLVHEYKPGEVYDGEVTRIVEFGAFVRIEGNTEGLVHVSEIAPFRVEHASDLLHEHMKVPVVIKDIDDRKRINLSIKRIRPDFFKPQS